MTQQSTRRHPKAPSLVAARWCRLARSANLRRRSEPGPCVRPRVSSTMQIDRARRASRSRIERENMDLAFGCEGESRRMEGELLLLRGRGSRRVGSCKGPNAGTETCRGRGGTVGKEQLCRACRASQRTHQALIRRLRLARQDHAGDLRIQSSALIDRERAGTSLWALSAARGRRTTGR